jgi:hypothetical protein
VTPAVLLPVKDEILELDDHSVLKTNLQFCIPSTTQTWLVSCADTVYLLLQFHYYCFITFMMFSLCAVKTTCKIRNFEIVNAFNYSIPYFISILQLHLLHVFRFGQDINI